MTAKPYDPTLKALVETEPESWPALLGQPREPTAVIDADIATVSGAADKELRVAADPPYLLHLEFVAGHDAAVLPRRLHVRNGLLEDRHDLRVRSAAVLLRPGADSRHLRGVYRRRFPGEKAYLTFRYQVVRVWKLAPEPLLTGGLALLPLAPISAVTEADLPGIIQRMGRRPRPAQPEAGGGGVGGGVHPAGAALHAGAGGTTVPRSGVHERVFDVSGHPGRGSRLQSPKSKVQSPRPTVPPADFGPWTLDLGP
jgi:hypothetical protein